MTYIPTQRRIDYEKGPFWDDWFRQEEIEAALKSATPEEEAILRKALAPITARQHEYWCERQREVDGHSTKGTSQ